MNDGAKTETDFLGHNGLSDDNLVNHLMNTMSEYNSGNQDDISHKYSPPPPGRKVVDLNESSIFWQQKVRFVFLARMPLPLWPGQRDLWRIPWHCVEVASQAGTV